MTNVLFVFETKAGRVTDYRLPGAIFHSRQAYNEFAPERRAYEAAVAAYAAAIEQAAIKETIRRRKSMGMPASRKSVRQEAEDLLRQDLSALCYDETEVMWHIARPGARLAAGYGTAADLVAIYG